MDFSSMWEQRFLANLKLHKVEDCILEEAIWLSEIEDFISYASSKEGMHKILYKTLQELYVHKQASINELCRAVRGRNQLLCELSQKGMKWVSV